MIELSSLNMMELFCQCWDQASEIMLLICLCVCDRQVKLCLTVFEMVSTIQASQCRVDMPHPLLELTKLCSQQVYSCDRSLIMLGSSDNENVWQTVSANMREAIILIVCVNQ